MNEINNNDVSKEILEFYNKLKNKLKEYKGIKFIVDNNLNKIFIIETDDFRIINGNEEDLHDLILKHKEQFEKKNVNIPFQLDSILMAYYDRKYMGMNENNMR